MNERDVYDEFGRIPDEPRDQSKPLAQPLRPLPGGQRLQLRGYRRYLRSLELAPSSVGNYACSIRRALEYMPEITTAAVAAYAAGSGDRFFPPAWRYFAPFARGLGFAVEPLRTAIARTPWHGDRVRPHLHAFELAALAHLAIRRRYDFRETCPLTAGDFAFGELGPLIIRDPLSPLDGWPVTAGEVVAAEAVLKWGWGDNARFERRNGFNLDDTRVLFIHEPGQLKAMSADDLISIARGIGDAKLDVKLRRLARAAVPVPSPSATRAGRIAERSEDDY